MYRISVKLFRKTERKQEINEVTKSISILRRLSPRTQSWLKNQMMELFTRHWLSPRRTSHSPVRIQGSIPGWDHCPHHHSKGPPATGQVLHSGRPGTYQSCTNSIPTPSGSQGSWHLTGIQKQHTKEREGSCCSNQGELLFWHLATLPLVPDPILNHQTQQGAQVQGHWKHDPHRGSHF